MTTLRRELRLKILEILESNIGYWEGKGQSETLGDIAVKIADVMLEKLFKEEKDDNTA